MKYSFVTVLFLTAAFLSVGFIQCDTDADLISTEDPFYPVFYNRFINATSDASIVGFDFEHDNDIDFFTAGSMIYLWENKGSFLDYEIVYALEPDSDTHDSLRSGGLASEDMNQDGFIDMIIGGTLGKLRILQNEEGTGFSDTLLWDFPYDLNALDVIDWNNDGLNDIVAGYTYAGPRDSRVALVLNLGDGVFADPIDLCQVETLMFSDLDADDFDNDGDPDILVAYSEINYAGTYYVNGTIVLLQNDGADNFTSFVVTHRGDGQFHNLDTRIHPRLAVADYDQDGDSDLAFGDNSGTVELLWNNGDATFQEPIILCDLGNKSMIAEADYDLDGDIDIIVSTRGYHLGIDGGLYVIYNNIKPMSLKTPQPNHLYLFDNQLDFGDSSTIIGPTTFRINRQVETDYVEFYVNDKLMHTDSSYPFEWRWSRLHFGEADVKIIGYFADGTTYTLQEQYTKLF